MMIIYDVTVIYKNGTTMMLDNVVKFEIEIGGNNSCKVVQLKCAKTRFIKMNVYEVMAVYKHSKFVFNPFKYFETKRLLERF